MPRVIAIDYGTKRCGIAVTDPDQIIAQGLETVSTAELMAYLDRALAREPFAAVVVGLPKRMDNTPSEIEPHIAGFVRRFRERHPEIPVERVDERLTSVMSHRAMIEGGATRKQRRDKGLADTISAALILQTYLSERR